MLVKRAGRSGCGGSAGAVTSEPSVPAPLLRNDFGALEWKYESHARRGVLGYVRHGKWEGESGGEGEARGDACGVSW